MTKITFEHIDPPGGGDGTFIPNGYKGMNWSEFGALNPTHDFPVSGYVNGTVSGKSVGFNADAGLASFTTTGADFDLKSGFFTGAWNDGLTVTVQAYDDGVLVATKIFVVDYSPGSQIRFGHRFDSIDTVTIDSEGGTDHDDADSGGGEHLAIDDLIVQFEGTGAQPLDHEHVHRHLMHDAAAHNGVGVMEP